MSTTMIEKFLLAKVANTLYEERRKENKTDKDVEELYNLARDVLNKKNDKIPKKDIEKVQLIGSDKEITENLKELAKEIFIKCDKDKDGLLNPKEYNDYFHLVDVDPLDDSGMKLAMLSFSVEGKGKALSLNDFYGYFRFQALVNRDDLLKNLSYIYGEDTVVERLNGKKVTPASSSSSSNNNNNNDDDDDDNVKEKLNDKKEISTPSNNKVVKNKPKKSINDIKFMEGDEITDNLKALVKEMFIKCDKDRDGILSPREYNEYFRLIDMEPMEESGIQMMLLVFAVEGGQKGFTLNDFYGFIKYQATTDRDELVRALTYVYGEDKLIDRLTDNDRNDDSNDDSNNNSNENNSSSTINNIGNNSYNKSAEAPPKSSKRSLDDIQFLDGQDVTPRFRQIIREIFVKCDKDRDGLLNSKEYNNYFSMIDVEPMDEAGISMMFSSFGIESRSMGKQGLTLNDFIGFIRFLATTDRAELVRSLKHVYGEQTLLDRLIGIDDGIRVTSTPSTSTPMNSNSNSNDEDKDQEQLVREIKENLTLAASINKPRANFQNIRLINNDGTPTPQLQGIAADLFRRCDLDRDGMINVKDYQYFIKLINNHPVSELGVQLIFKCFGLETNYRGLSYNDFIGFINYNAMFERNELINDLIRVYGEENLLQRLRGRY